MTTKINIGGQEREFTFCLGMQGDILEDLNMGFIEFCSKVDSNPFKYRPIVMQYAYNYKNENKVELSTILDWIEQDGDIHSIALQKFNIAYTNYLTKNVPIQDSKKKVVKI
jgi:hypothetical protein